MDSGKCVKGGVFENEAAESCRPKGPEPVDESMCPKAARYKIRPSGRKITPPRFEQGDFEFMVDVDPEVEVSAKRAY